jgi:hypothetical protein
MKNLRTACVVSVFAAVSFARPAEQAPASPRQALQALNDLIGSWRGTGVPAGSRDEQQKGFWTETISWEWQFKGKDAWLKANFTRGKHFQSGELRYLPDRHLYQFKTRTAANETKTYVGKIKQRVLTLERDADEGTERLVFTLLHWNRLLYRVEVRPPSKTLFSRRFQVGATKEGVPFAEDDGRPECIVSGGLGTIAVTYQGQTYHVCCGGCRAEFNENPEKYVKEYLAKKARQPKE